jgi:hypothetical protein
MKIGVYKPFMPVYFDDDKDDMNAVSYEVVNVAKIFAERGHEMVMLSPTDLHRMDTPLHNIRDANEEDDRFDRIILYSGSFHLDENGDGIIPKLRKKTDRLDFLLTDLRLLPENRALLHEFNHIYTQATRPIFGDDTYGGVAEFYPYQKAEVEPGTKDIGYYFGGTERGRLDDFLEYVWRPDCLVTTKSATLGINNRVNRHEYKDLLDRAKYSVVIADEEYNDRHFITPRHYENISHNIVSFVDSKFDPDAHIIPHDDWRRVNNYIELREKINHLEANPLERERIAMEQWKEFKPEFVDGSYVYNKLR